MPDECPRLWVAISLCSRQGFPSRVTVFIELSSPARRVSFVIGPLLTPSSLPFPYGSLIRYSLGQAILKLVCVGCFAQPDARP